MAARTPREIYAILAYSKTLNKTKQEFDEDALVRRQHTTLEKQAALKAESFARRLNAVEHQGVTDWVAKPSKQDYRPSGLVRGSQIINPKDPTQTRSKVQPLSLYCATIYAQFLSNRAAKYVPPQCNTP